MADGHKALMRNFDGWLGKIIIIYKLSNTPQAPYNMSHVFFGVFILSKLYWVHVFTCSFFISFLKDFLEKKVEKRPHNTVLRI